MTNPYDLNNPNRNLNDVDAFIGDCVIAVEANSFESHCLWAKYHKETNWKQIGSGFGPTVGRIADMPVNVSININIINGHRVLFYYGMSMVVHFGMIEEWIRARLPAGTKLTDAQNFHHAIHHTADLNKKVAA